MLSRDDLSDPERMIFDSVETGTRVDVDGADIRPELIVQLATSERAPGGGISRGVHASFAHFPAPLDLRGLTLLCPINLERCRFDHPVVADDARTVSLSLPDCELPSVSAGQLSVRGNLDLRGVHAEAVLLPGARVGGDLVLEAADLKRPGGLVFDASGLRVEHRLNCDGLRAHGRMLLRSARIGGPVLLANARLTGGGEVFDGTRMTIEESVLAEGLQVDGVLVLYGADVRGQVNLDRARMRNGGKDALAADGCRVGSLHAHEIYVQGGLRLTSAQVRDEVSLNGARLECPKGEASAYHVPVALLGDNLEIGSNLQLIGATVAGQLRLDRAHIGVSLVVVRTKLDNGEHVALHGADMHVGQRVFLLESQIRGDVVLSGARVDGMLDIGDTTFATGGSLDLRDARLALWTTRPGLQATRSRCPRARTGRSSPVWSMGPCRGQPTSRRGSTGCATPRRRTFRRHSISSPRRCAVAATRTRLATWRLPSSAHGARISGLRHGRGAGSSTGPLATDTERGAPSTRYWRSSQSAGACSPGRPGIT